MHNVKSNYDPRRFSVLRNVASEQFGASFLTVRHLSLSLERNVGMNGGAGASFAFLALNNFRAVTAHCRPDRAFGARVSFFWTLASPKGGEGCNDGTSSLGKRSPFSLVSIPAGLACSVSDPRPDLLRFKVHTFEARPGKHPAAFLVVIGFALGLFVRLPSGKDRCEPVPPVGAGLE